MKSFQDMVCLGHYKLAMGHHLLLKSPKGLEDSSWPSLSNDMGLPGEDWQMDFTQMPVSPGYNTY